MIVVGGESGEMFVQHVGEGGESGIHNDVLVVQASVEGVGRDANSSLNFLLVCLDKLIEPLVCNLDGVVQVFRGRYGWFGRHWEV